MDHLLKITADSFTCREWGEHCSLKILPDSLLRREYKLAGCGFAELRAPYLLERRGKTEPPHVTVWLVLEGEVHYQTELGEFTARPGDTVILNSEVDCRCTVTEGVFSHLHFYLDMEPEFAPAVYPGSYAKEIKELFFMCYRECTENDGRDTERVTHLGGLLFSYLLSELRATPGSRRMRKLYRLLEENMASPWSTSSLAAAMHLSPSSLYALCRDQLGSSPGDVIAKVKFRYAAELLRRTDAPMAAVAEAIGYDNAFSFSKACRRVTGKSPTQIRRET